MGRATITYYAVLCCGAKKTFQFKYILFPLYIFLKSITALLLPPHRHVHQHRTAMCTNTAGHVHQHRTAMCTTMSTLMWSTYCFNFSWMKNCFIFIFFSDGIQFKMKKSKRLEVGLIFTIQTLQNIIIT